MMTPSAFPLLAHQTWFQSGFRDLDWSFALQPASLLLLGVAVALTLGVRAFSRLWNGIDVPALGRLVPFMPFAVRIHIAVSLIVMLSMGFYLSPAMELSVTPLGFLLGLVAVLVAIGMATGWHARAAAALLILAGPLGMLEFGVSPVLQRIDLLGLAAFVVICGAGRWSADHELGRTRDADVLTAARGIWALKVGVGLALIVVAFAEKIANPDLALAFLSSHPELNVPQLLGLPLTDLQFVRLAGAVEVLFGLLLISGALPQVGVIAIGIPFNATLWFFGAVELAGHLPVYGAMLVVLVYGSHPVLRPHVSALLPGRTRRGSGPAHADGHDEPAAPGGPATAPALDMAGPAGLR